MLALREEAHVLEQWHVGRAEQQSSRPPVESEADKVLGHSGGRVRWRRSTKCDTGGL